MRPILSLFSLTAVLSLVAVPAYGDLEFTITPSFQTGASGTLPPDADTCLSPTCALFSGSLIDTDTDGSFIFLPDISVTWAAGNPSSGFLSLDNTFFEDVPGGLEGDADDNPFPDSYTGPIFGIDIAPDTPAGIYDGTVTINAEGGTEDPFYLGFTVSQQFTVDVVPEPSPLELAPAGLLLLILFKFKRRRRAP